jgi:chromosomal replication initiation ATPase DnaA
MTNSEIYSRIVKKHTESLDDLKEAVLEYELKKFREEVITNLTTIDNLIECVCKRRMINKNALNGRTRLRGAVEGRQIIWYLLKHKVVNNELTLRQMGEMFGRDHSTALYGVKKVGEIISYDRNFREEVMIVANEFGAKAAWDTGREELTFDNVAVY